MRIVEMEVANRNLFPRIKVLERAFTPSIPVRPDYSRDAMYGLAGSTLFGLLLLWFYSKLNDPRRYLASHSSQQPNIYSNHTELITPAAALTADQAPPATHALEHRGQRELSLVEVEALWAAAAPEDRLLIALLLSGMTFDEIANLRPDAFDWDRGLIDVKVDHARPLPIAPKLAELVGHFEADPGLFSGPHGIVARIAQLPYSAGLADPASVDTRALRHTYICFLVRQGVKFDELQRIVGGLDPNEMQQYSDMMPPMPGKQLEDVMLVYPALETKLLPQ